MKKIIVILTALYSMFILTGCFNNNFNQNIISAPEPKSITIEGTWNIINKVITDENLAKNLDIDNYDSVVIEENNIYAGNSTINNFKLKLKRIKKEKFFVTFLKETYFDETLFDEFIEIYDIYDNTNVCFNFIRTKYDEKAFILYSGYLLELEKINDGAKVASFQNSVDEGLKVATENQSNLIILDEKYYNTDVGVLIGLKKSSTVDENTGELSDVSYRTLWVYLNNGELKEVKELENQILVPRKNGFSKIEVSSNESSSERYEELKVTNIKQGEKETIKTSKKIDTYSEINFIGSDYIGLQYYNGKNFKNIYNKYKIIPIDNVELKDSLDLISIFGENIKDIYELSKNNAEDDNKKGIDLSVNDYKNISMIRNNGQWEVQGRINSKFNNNNFINFIIEVSPIKTLINYDNVLIPWNKLREVNPTIKDSISAPNGRIIISLEEGIICVYEYADSKINQKLVEIDINKDETIIMSEWATGDFVSKWNTIVDYNDAKIVK